MVDPYADRHQHSHEWSLEPRVEIMEERAFCRYYCTYAEVETATDHERDEVYEHATYECEAYKCVVWDLSFEVAEDASRTPSEAESLVEAPPEAIEHIHDYCLQDLKESFMHIFPDDDMDGFSKDMDGIRVVAEKVDEYAEEA